MEPTLDQVRQELADIHTQLLELPTEAFAQRSELRTRQHELRQTSHRLLKKQARHDAETLETAFTRLSFVRDHLVDKRLASASNGDPDIDAVFTDAVNKAIDAGVGTDQIVTRLEEIVAKLRSSS
ncbi:MAG: hypothetical protein U9N56_02020 [Actinomycetota bacterium]|nr:hypothetical protein [Actinomycetota bacterium]